LLLLVAGIAVRFCDRSVTKPLEASFCLY